MSASEQSFIQRLHSAPTEQLGEMMRLRLLGDLGPALEQQQSWAELLADAYRAGDARFQHNLKQQLLALISPYHLPSKFQQLNQAEHTDWRKFSTALLLASKIDWSKDGTQTQDLHSLLNGWLRNALDPLPRPRNIGHEAQCPGYPQIDLLSSLLALAGHTLTWDTGLAIKLWKSIETEDAQTELEKRAKAERLWEIAAWALLSSNSQAHLSLARHIDTLSQALEAANWQPGDLTLLFLRTELKLGAEAGAQRIAELICAVPYPKDVLRRQPLAIQLDYFAEDNKDTRQRLTQMYREKAAEILRPPLMMFKGLLVATKIQTRVDAAHQHTQQMAAWHSLDDLRSRVH